MRVIAGSARGRPLIAPKIATTRPTSDLIRGAIFDMLAVEAEDWSTVLDLYAGSGALGIEALSRGADRVDFVEKVPAACQAIRANLTRLGFTDRARVYCQAVRDALPGLRGPYGIVLVDAPYADPEVDAVLVSLVGSPMIQADTILVVEHARDRIPVIELLDRFKTRQHGGTGISLFRLRE